MQSFSRGSTEVVASMVAVQVIVQVQRWHRGGTEVVLRFNRVGAAGCKGTEVQIQRRYRGGLAEVQRQRC